MKKMRRSVRTGGILIGLVVFGLVSLRLTLDGRVSRGKVLVDTKSTRGVIVNSRELEASHDAIPASQIGFDLPLPTTTPLPLPTIPPTSTPQPTLTRSPDALTVKNVKLTADPEVYRGTCKKPIEFTFTGEVEGSGSGTVTYVWERSDGVSSTTPQLITFEQGGMKTVTTNWFLGKEGDEATGSMKLKIVSPNTLESKPVEVVVRCA
jgi:hypothetical protein